MNEYAPRADKLPLDVAEQAARVSEVVAAVKKQLSPDGGRLSDGPLHLEKLEELSADDHNSRFTDADDFWENGMDPPRVNPSQDDSDTPEKLPSKFVNNFWQYFFPDEMFKGDLLGPTVLNKPPRKLLKETGGELLASVQQLFGMLFEDTMIDSHKLAALESAAGEEHLNDLKEAMFILYELALRTVTQQDVIAAECSSAHEYLCK
jgi:hypothetical protein